MVFSFRLSRNWENIFRRARKNRNGKCGGAAACLVGRKVVQTGRDFWSSALAKISTEPWLTTTSGALAGSRGQLRGD